MLHTDVATVKGRKLDEIRLSLDWQCPLIGNSPGLMSGILGRLLFLDYLAKSEGGRISESLLEDKLAKVVSALNGNPSIDLSMSSGWSGLGWFLAYLERSGRSTSAYADLSAEIEEMVSSYILRNKNKIQFDFLNGFPGYFAFLINTNSFEEVFSEVIDFLYDTGYLLPDSSDASGMRIVEGVPLNLGISHGILSMSYFFAEALNRNISYERTELLLRRQTEFVLNKLSKPMRAGFGSYISYHSLSNSIDFPTRLAWCYGDLTTALILFKTSSIEGFESYRPISIEMALHNAKRFDPADTKVCDAGFCHGSAGISYILKKFFHLTNELTFQHASEKWLQRCFEQAVFPDGPAGYKAYLPKSVFPDEWYPTTGLLEGTAGIGLVMLSDTLPDNHWETAFLLD